MAAGSSGGTDGLVPQVDALGGRIRRLPPPTWTGPTAEAFAAGLARAARLVDAAAEALVRAGEAARRSGGS